MPSFGDMVRTRHRIRIVVQLLLHVTTLFMLVYILFVAYSNSLGAAVADTAVKVMGPRAAIRAWGTLTPLIGFLHKLVPRVHPVPAALILMVLPSILIEGLLTIHARGRRRQLAMTAATAGPSVQASPPAEGAWGDLFKDPRPFGAAEASLLVVAAPWDMTEPQQPERPIIAEFVLSHLAGILGSVVALSGLGLVLAGVFM